MKTKRHSKIVELINAFDIETQEELAQKLEESGFVVTQATVSRDIRDLKLSKVILGDGRQKYSLMPKQDGISEKYVRILREAFVSMDMAQNILVLKTVSGMAMAVAAALDSMQMSEIVGCIAGDDTIMAAIRSTDDTVVVMERIRKLVYKNE
ncbi:arginine repressor [Lachnospiraceae oral taxon 107 str. F0167]|jgi:arginine repressor|uniref:arginine repressor n=1 Tax=Lachnoanaerobaculum sp. Marseille-Q4761 TaxID=2819511 RepID=UPI00020833EC|nr:arginine repressor [Lachnoanaerobaculum sp. Marseille-Q4761]EGG89686.1 arginine repressor [Lachnospiraceae oral taxon 107 str. F0167]MBO1871872.1 arginine repressor [Lachnoanaerobaculum sp. Marseille-Q4761]RKW56200.1 MAG: arginine repressor [Lachnospiraceae bacterium]